MRISMSPHSPLTLCPPAKIDFSQKPAPEATDFGDIYFSTDGGAQECRTVFLGACGLPEGWKGRGYFAIGELGFGTGLNFLETLKLWRERKMDATAARLHFISVEKYPLDHDQLETALSALDCSLADKTRLMSQWPGRIKGLHNLTFGNVKLTLIHDDVLDGLSAIEGRIDAWFLDGFSPSKNPDMWSPDVMTRISRLSRPGARLGTFTVARAVCDGLINAGFKITKKPGFGRKRDRLEAVFPGKTDISLPRDIRPVIIGAGIAGASLAHSFAQKGLKSVVIDPSDGTAASGNPAAIIKPRLDLQDRPVSRFFLSSYMKALLCYKEVGAVRSKGLVHICRTEKEALRYAKLLKQGALPDSHFSQGTAPDHYAFPQALIINPEKARQLWLSGAVRVTGTAVKSEDGKVYDATGKIIASGTHIIWAGGFGIRSLPQFAHLKLRYSRGQLSWSNSKISEPKTYGGYAIPMGAETLIGATHKRLDGLSPFEPRNDDDQENLEKFEEVFKLQSQSSTRSSRSSVRVTTPSTLPLIFGGEKEWGLTGLGSRGFVFAPLLAEAIAAKICGEVLPVSNKVWTRFRARENAQPGSAS